MADPLIPSWLPDDHPFYVSSPTAERVRRGFRPNRIFLNIPYASRYSNLEVAVLSTATAYDLDPCMAKERSKLEIRMRKIVELVLTCKYGFTDLSYATRMNMPFELGVLLAWGKETFVITSHPTRTIKSLSDLNFGDIEFHRRTVKLLIDKFSRWIERTASSKRLMSATLFTRYRRWQAIRRSLGSAKKLAPVHPSEVLLEEFLGPLGLSQYRLSREISVPPRRINEIVHRKRAITADTALRFARFFSTSERFWLNLQSRYDLEVERDRLGRLRKEVSVLARAS